MVLRNTVATDRLPTVKAPLQPFMGSREGGMLQVIPEEVAGEVQWSQREQLFRCVAAGDDRPQSIRELGTEVAQERPHKGALDLKGADNEVRPEQRCLDGAPYHAALSTICDVALRNHPIRL
jgi:hypothetical protein